MKKIMIMNNNEKWRNEMDNESEIVMKKIWNNEK